MVKKNKDDSPPEKKAKIKKLKLTKETVKDLAAGEAANIKGGIGGNTAANCSSPCPATKLLCPKATFNHCPGTAQCGGGTVITTVAI